MIINMYDKKIQHILNNECECGEPMVLPFELLSGQKIMICAKCGKDNTGPEWPDDYEGL